MKKYSDYAKASISMSNDRLFLGTLDTIFSENRISAIFECGTFKVLGSTTTLANAALKSGTPVEQFITVEIDPDLHKEAKANLARFPFVTPLLGMTVDRDEAAKFIANDEAINHHEAYPDIFIDDVIDPKGFYLNELSGKLSASQKKKKFFRAVVDRLTATRPENDILGKYLPAMSEKNPLILLDSAGGIGYLEFTRVLEIMNGNPYFIILDDITHLKHFRSYRHIKESKEFTVIAESVENGWIAAKHHGRKGN